MRVVSWNIHWGCGKDGRIRIHAIIDVLRKLNPDVICLQEVAANHPELEGNATANQFRQLAGAFGGYHLIEPRRVKSTRTTCPACSATCSSRNTASPRSIATCCPGRPIPDSPAGMPRGADRSRARCARRQAAPADHPPRVLLAAAAHGAGAAHPRTALRKPAPARASTSRDPELDAPYQLGFRPASAIYCGDFNFAPDADDYQALLAPDDEARCRWSTPGASRTASMARAPTAGLHGYPWPERPDCYDYFFVTEDLVRRVAEVEVQSETAASDHQPIVLDLIPGA